MRDSPAAQYPRAMSFLRRGPDAALMALVEEAGRNVQRCGLLLHDLLIDYPERAALAQDLKVCEQEGDRITHDIIHRLAGRGRVRAPFDAGDGYALATALDDIVDHSEQVAAQLGLYGVEAPMEQAVEFTEVLVGAGEQIAQALRCLRTGTDLAPHLVEIHRLENEGDRLQRDGVASLFAGGIDPMVVIRWKDIFESLEAAVDACETVAHVLEGITLKQRGRRASERGPRGRCDRAAPGVRPVARPCQPNVVAGALACELAPAALPTKKTWKGVEAPRGQFRQHGPAGGHDRPARRATANTTSLCWATWSGCARCRRHPRPLRSGCRLCDFDPRDRPAHRAALRPGAPPRSRVRPDLGTWSSIQVASPWAGTSEIVDERGSSPAALFWRASRRPRP